MLNGAIINVKKENNISYYKFTYELASGDWLPPDYISFMEESYVIDYLTKNSIKLVNANIYNGHIVSNGASFDRFNNNIYVVLGELYSDSVLVGYRLSDINGNIYDKSLWHVYDMCDDAVRDMHFYNDTLHKTLQNMQLIINRQSKSKSNLLKDYSLRIYSKDYPLPKYNIMSLNEILSGYLLRENYLINFDLFCMLIYAMSDYLYKYHKEKVERDLFSLVNLMKYFTCYIEVECGDVPKLDFALFMLNLYLEKVDGDNSLLLYMLDESKDFYSYCPEFKTFISKHEKGRFGTLCYKGLGK